MKILEFTGLPGSGKSTICELLERELKLRGYRVLNMHIAFSHENFLKKIKIKCNNKKAFYAPINRDFNKLVHKLTLSNYINTEEWIQIIEIMNYRIHKEAKNYDFILMDEGIIQAITALYHNITIENKDEIIGLINTFCKEYIYGVGLIEIKTDLDTVCDRLRNRNRQGDSFVDKDTNKMKSSLLLKDSNIHFVSETSRFRIQHINGNVQLNAQLNDILKSII